MERVVLCTVPEKQYLDMFQVADLIPKRRLSLWPALNPWIKTWKFILITNWSLKKGCWYLDNNNKAPSFLRSLYEIGEDCHSTQDTSLCLKSCSLKQGT